MRGRIQMGKSGTEQEKFWAGQFGDDYIDRNREGVASNLALFTKVVARTGSIDSVIEFGANIGLNILALKQILPKAEFSAIEINEKAVVELRKIAGLKVYHQSIHDFSCDYARDMILMKGVLIHLNPDLLSQIYDVLYQTSNRYICLAEYYNPKPIEISYRGHSGKLFKRDFAGEMLDRFPDLSLVDYGFMYHRDAVFPDDDITWFLLEKRCC